MPPIKTEPGVRIKSEHEPRFDFSSIPRPPVPSVSVKQEDRKPPSVPIKQEDRKPDLSSSTYDGQSRRRRRFRHAKNFMVHRLRDGETIRAHYNQSEGTVVFTLSRGAAAVIDAFPEEGDRAEDMIFQRLRRANFNVQSTEPFGLLARRVRGALPIYLSGILDYVSVKVERTSGHGHAPRAVAKPVHVMSESKPIDPMILSVAEELLVQQGHAKPLPLSASSSGRSQPAAHIPQVPSSTPVLEKPSEGIFDMFRPEEQSKIVSHHIASENRASPSLDSSSDLTSGFSHTLIARAGRVFSYSLPEPKSPFLSQPALWPTNSSTAPSLFGPPAGAHPRPFAQLPPPDAPVLAAAVKPAPGVIVIDSSPESYPASSPKQHLPKQRVPGITAPSAWATAIGQSASPFSTNPLSSWAKRMEVLMGQFDDPMSERAVRSRAKDK